MLSVVLIRAVAISWSHRTQSLRSHATAVHNSISRCCKMDNKSECSNGTMSDVDIVSLGALDVAAPVQTARDVANHPIKFSVDSAAYILGLRVGAIRFNASKRYEEQIEIRVCRPDGSVVASTSFHGPVTLYATYNVKFEPPCLIEPNVTYTLNLKYVDQDIEYWCTKPKLQAFYTESGLRLNAEFKNTQIFKISIAKKL
ncbi:hypothetical protein B566_EDAN007735 [Ephemera danica]|nr:hypothetical protein B566_EDAN007735 [Ephemera danica]